jgi:hypothetical protein
MARIVKKRPLQGHMLSLSLYEIYDRRRKYPRVIIELPATMKVSDNFETEVQLYDLSPDGIQIRCDRKAAKIICPEGKITKEILKREVKIIFDLYYRREKRSVCISVIPIYLLFISDDLISFGMQFYQHDKKMLKIISDYIDYEVAPNLEELEEILAEKIGKIKTADIQVPVKKKQEKKKYKESKSGTE